MNADPDIYDEMHLLPLSTGTADRLLSGELAPDDAPPAGRDLAVLFSTAKSPATPDELAHRGRVVASAVAEVLSSAPLSEPAPSRRRSMLSKVLTAKVAAAATIAALGLGTAAAAAAATGALPGTDHANSHAASGQATSAAAHSSAGKPTPTPGVVPPTGPANIHAQAGLCTAFLAAQKSTPGSTPPQYSSSTAFKALIIEHGGIASTTTYCRTVAHPNTNQPDTSANTDTPEGTGKPADTGKPANTGKPADAGKPASPGNSAGQGDTHGTTSGRPASTPAVSTPASQASSHH